ncbi:MAG: sugar phosphate isomerase/epimerase family protein, partial [Chloroflexota bacterium]
MEQVLLSAGMNNIEACVELAHVHGLGIEVMAFAFPNVLDGDWEQTVRDYQVLLGPVSGPITLHGPFMDMAPGSPDARINQICVERYHHAISIASQLGAEKIVFHANFIAAIHNISYREGWHSRNVDFWGEMAEYAQREGVLLAVENMWEFDPDIIVDVLTEVNHPHLRACLDVGHAHIFGPDYAFETWLSAFEPFLIHVHMNNTHGKLDTHNALGDGIIDYDAILNRFRRLPEMPTFVLEMYELHHMRDSLPFFELAAM